MNERQRGSLHSSFRIPHSAFIISCTPSLTVGLPHQSSPLLSGAAVGLDLDDAREVRARVEDVDAYLRRRDVGERDVPDDLVVEAYLAAIDGQPLRAVP